MKCSRCGSEVSGGGKFCPKCGGKLDDFVVKPVSERPVAAAEGVFQKDKYLVNQKMLSIREVYTIYDEHLNELFFVKRLLIAVRRHIYIYLDRKCENPALTIKQINIIMFLFCNYELIDAAGQTIARFRRRNLISMLRRTWDIMTPDGKVIGRALEDSWGKAIFRRFGPFGEMFKTDFIISIGDKMVGKYVRRITLSDKYYLDLTPDPQKTLDRKIAVALGILLDAGEWR